MSANRITVRLDFDGRRQLGHGKIRLLELIDAHGSISSAAREMKMSYRRAWLLADEVNRMFTQSVFETQLGGKGGGHARLTDFGQELVRLYRAIEADAESKFTGDMARLSEQLAEPVAKS